MKKTMEFTMEELGMINSWYGMFVNESMEDERDIELAKRFQEAIDDLRPKIYWEVKCLLIERETRRVVTEGKSGPEALDTVLADLSFQNPEKEIVLLDVKKVP
jgi:hypothetical protein